MDPAGYDAAMTRKITKSIADALGWEYREYKNTSDWTYEHLVEVVKNSGAKNWTDLRQKNMPAHYAARKFGWRESLCADMGWHSRSRRPNGYWTFERCLEDAKRYPNRKAWEAAKTGGHGAASAAKLLSRISKAMGWRTKKPIGYWSVGVCVEHLRKEGFSSFTEWQKTKKHGYASLSREDKEAVCAIMGWTITEQHPAGYWTYERCLEAAEKSGAKSINDWKKTGCKGFVTAASGAKKWTRDIAEKLGWDSAAPNGYWTYERCLKAATNSGADNMADFVRLYKKAATGMYRGGWSRKIAEELGWDMTYPPGHWTYEHCLEAAKESGATTITEWQACHGASYYGALKIDAVWDIAAALNFEQPKKYNGYWQYDTCVKDARESGAHNLTEWLGISGGGGYAFLLKNGLMEEFRKEIGWERMRVPAGYWTYETCLTDAMESGAVSVADWRHTSNGALQAARSNKWIKDIADAMGWSLSHDDSAKDTVIYWYVWGDYVYIGETSAPDKRHDEHFLGRNGSIVFNYIDDEVEPQYVTDKAQDMPRKLTGYVARRAERMFIKRAARDGYKVLNKIHNPQWNGTKFSWEEPLEEVA